MNKNPRIKPWQRTATSLATAAIVATGFWAANIGAMAMPSAAHEQSADQPSMVRTHSSHAGPGGQASAERSSSIDDKPLDGKARVGLPPEDQFQRKATAQAAREAAGVIDEVARDGGTVAKAKRSRPQNGAPVIMKSLNDPKGKPPAPGTVSCEAPKCVVTVEGNQLKRDGKPWIPKGVNLTGLTAPREYLVPGVYTQARENYGPTLLRHLQDVGVDTVRFQISIAGLDPLNKMGDGKMTAEHKKTYVNDILASIDLAERYGMNVILNLANIEPTAYEDASYEPHEEAVRAWKVLSRATSGRSSVIYDAYNEPWFGKVTTLDKDASVWKEWGQGYQALVSVIRKSGAKQPIVLDGLSISRVWRKNKDEYVPKDPANALVFGLHPYPTIEKQARYKDDQHKINYMNTKDLDYWIDGWCDKRACLATEFFTGTTHDPDLGHCVDKSISPEGKTSADVAREFIDYMHKRNIGIVMFPGDWWFRLFINPLADQPKLTTYQGFEGCNTKKKHMGPGEMLSTEWLKLKKAGR